MPFALEQEKLRLLSDNTFDYLEALKKKLYQYLLSNGHDMSPMIDDEVWGFDKMHSHYFYCRKCSLEINIEHYYKENKIYFAGDDVDKKCTITGKNLPF